MFKRTRYQHGSVEREERKKGPAVWVYRWWEEDANGKLLHRKQQIGDVETYPSESAAQAAADALRLTVNNQCQHKNLKRTTISTLWKHYSQEELPLKALSTQDCYSEYAKNWILPRWGQMLLEQVKTVEVERWLRATEVADGTKAKIKCVMSALFSHAVRWELCGHNPISSGIPVGTGGKRGPSTGVRVSAKRRKSPLKLTAEQVAEVLTTLEFRDQLLVFMDAGLGVRRGELAALRLMDCDFEQQVFDIQHSYYWRRGGHLKCTKTEASAKLLPMHPSLKTCLAGLEISESSQPTRAFRLLFGKIERQQTTRSGFRTKEEDPTSVQEDWHHRCGMAYLSAHGGNHAGGDGRAPAHNPRLLAAQQPSRHEQVPAGNIKDEALGAGQVGRRHPAWRILAQANPNSVSLCCRFFGCGDFCSTLIVP